MASIEKRQTTGGPRYRVRVRRRGLRPVSRTFPTLTLARRWGISTEHAWLTTQDLPRPAAARYTLADLLVRYRRDVVPRLAPGTQRNRVIHVRWWQHELGYLRLADVTSGTLVECREQLAQTRSAGTTNQYLSTLGHVLSVALHQWQWLDENPMRRVQKLRLPPARTRYLSDPERQRLLEACRASTNRVLYLVVMLALNTGSRKMELLSLTWSDVDLRRRELTFRMTKSRRVRVVPLAQHVFDLLRDHTKVRRLDTQLVFPRPDGLQPVDIRYAWAIALQAAKVADFRWHDLRHTFASYTAMSGASVIDLQTLLGHTTPAMAARYTHLAQPHLARVVEQMSRTMFP
jgi:integrase